MVEILLYQTSKEAEQELEKYKRDNDVAFEKLKQNPRNISGLLKSQRYCFVAELAAYIDDKPGKYYYQSVMHPFNGFTELCDNIPSLVEEVKKAIKHQTPYNIETVLYTVENHDQENQEARERAEEGRDFIENLPLNKNTENISEEELTGCLQLLEEIESAEVRGLTKQEREEFVKLYGRE